MDIWAFFGTAVKGALVSLSIFGVVLLCSLPLGVLVATLRLSKNKLVSAVTAGYIYCMRGTPLLLQLMFFFFGLPVVGITLQRETAAVLAFVLNYTAYFAEIFRGGIQSVPLGQWEASKILGFSKVYTFLFIVFPQGLKKSIPALTNEVITLFKDTSLIYILGIGELLRAGKIAANTYGTLSPFLIVGVVYLLLIGVFTKVCSMVEKKYSYYR